MEKFYFRLAVLNNLEGEKLSREYSEGLDLDTLDQNNFLISLSNEISYILQRLKKYFFVMERKTRNNRLWDDLIIYKLIITANYSRDYYLRMEEAMKKYRKFKDNDEGLVLLSWFLDAMHTEYKISSLSKKKIHRIILHAVGIAYILIDCKLYFEKIFNYNEETHQMRRKYKHPWLQSFNTKYSRFY